VNHETLIRAVDALNDLGIEADAPPDQDRLVLNIRGICIDEFEDWVSIELRHITPDGEF
jgi:hypothetical protein